MNLAIGSASYNKTVKAQFKRESKNLLHAVAKALGLKKNDFDLRYNPAGIACSGDATLHTDNVYVSFNLDGCMESVLVRTCKGRKDTTGGHNRWYSFGQLASNGAAGLVEFVRDVIAVP